MELSNGSGRGRGRGSGVPVLPSGLWESLNSGNDEKKNSIELPSERTEDVDTGGSHEHDYVPMGFGRGRGGGRAGGRGDGRGRGRGPERDMKGKDWECPSCTNVNWSWRSTCNKCNTNKPASVTAENEHRDGAGGGFNERQNRASAAAVEIDEDGFDDFGRRVKKSRRADRQAKEEAALSRLSEKYKHLLPSSVADFDYSKYNESTAAAATKAAVVAEQSKSNDRDTSATARRSDGGGRYDDAVESSPHKSSKHDKGRSGQASREERRDDNDYRHQQHDDRDAKRSRQEDHRSDARREGDRDRGTATGYQQQRSGGDHYSNNGNGNHNSNSGGSSRYDSHSSSHGQYSDRGREGGDGGYSRR